jgi:peptidoglycan/xylan/chitin deacetylase (PgdA/CDA1 family)
MTGRSMVYLMYHELEIPGRRLCRPEPSYVRYVLNESEFRAQIAYLKTTGYRGLTVSEAVKCPDGNNVALTFDDGSETDSTAAAPILRQAGFGATFYLTTGWLGRPGYLSTAQIRELTGQGFEIGCHSMTHSYLDGLIDKDLRREIADAKDQLEQIAGVPVYHFSCPGGRYDNRVAKVAKAAGYRTVATSRIQANSGNTDPFTLGRVAILRGLRIEKFAHICQGDALPRLRRQGAVRQAAKQVLGNSLYDRLREVLLGRLDSTG